MRKPRTRSEGTNKMKDWPIRLEFVKRNLDFFKSMTFVNEMGINSRNIVDLAALDFSKKIFYGFEIKSEADNLQRLYKQLSTYVTFFNIVYVVAHESHTETIKTLINNNLFMRKVGHIEVSSNLEFRELKKAELGTPRFDTFIRNLDSEELGLLCESKGQYQGWEKKSVLVDKIKRLVTMDEIYKHMENKVRKYYYKKCEHCGSTLYHNKRDRDGNIVSYCYECGRKITKPTL